MDCKRFSAAGSCRLDRPFESLSGSDAMTATLQRPPHIQGLSTLQRHYREPLLAASMARAGGMGVVGLTGVTIPVELVLAVGRFPVLVPATMGAPTPTADIYIEPVVSPE